MKVSDSVVIAADAMELYNQIADPSQMPRWSPENVGADVPSPGTPLKVGDVFHGSNKRGRVGWRTRCKVVAADPGSKFAFNVVGHSYARFIPLKIATWTYDFEPVDGGTQVTESWHDDRLGWPDWAAAGFDKAATGGKLFSDFQRINIARTLKKMKADFES